MKNLLFIFLFLSQIVYSQDFKAVKSQKINIKNNEQIFFPKLSPDGKKILFTKQNFNGLYLYDLKNKKIVQISDKQGAGYCPVFSENGKELFFRENEYEGMRKISAIYSYNIEKKTKTIIEAKNRNVSVPKVSGDKLFYTLDGEAKNSTLKNSSKSNNIWTFIERQKIVLYNKDVKKILTPNGEGNYIWVSLSPDKKRILYTFAGHGTYISDLNGKIISDLGYLNAPVWYNNDWVVGMKDYDNNYKFTSSDIFAVSSDGKKQINLTDTKDIIELYPQCSAQNKKIVFHTAKGEIYCLKIKE